MNLEWFWTHKTVLAAEEMDVGFSTFSAGHLAWLAALAAGIAWIDLHYRHGGEERRDNMRKVMAIFLILSEIFKQCLMALTGAPVKSYLPLEVCSFAEYVILFDAMWLAKKFFGQMLAFIFLPAALMTLIFPTVTDYPLINYYTIHQFVLHGIIVAYVLVRLVEGKLMPRYAGIWTSLLKMGVIAILVYLIDVTFEVNFMFLTETEGNPMLEILWRFAGGRGGWRYILVLVLFVVAVLHVEYFIIILTRRIREKKL